MKNALTIDVEDYFQVAALSETIRPEDWNQHELRVEKNTHRLLDMFDEVDVKATFFVLGWVAEACPRLVPEIVKRGHEVASHGYSHQLVYEQTPDVFRQETARSKTILENQAQRPIIGYRAASYSITKESLWALDILAEQGFVWDSSIFPVKHDRYGIPGAERWPHRLETPSGHELIEFPLTTLKIGPLNLPIAGGGYFRLYPYAFSRAGLGRVNRADEQPFIFYLHPWELDPGQPRIKASWKSRFRHYNNLDKCEGRLKQLLKDFEFDTVGNVLTDQGLPIQFTEPQHRRVC
ncbi:polysaccharide deacetylase family protein (PEP-CTERM system associated) [Natronocella acetinitrilica]|uniref:Polysaccharide deacetylase family protein (PEP-CTERM system associated) n=1 Tax=Natronocella acetinitrilica TaxID=414046 RepID=A0AAE3G9W4_9GAMM|nr:XrtA system polysaccharide deacetylase [Natronocella acetinitrilica]MCP1677203.1 polysaccharide deacetylase family protein (PEP-CTERM system associated) [Natronocella acetinitrilica]